MGYTDGNNADGLLDDNELVILENLARKGLDKPMAEGLGHVSLWILDQVSTIAINLPKKTWKKRLRDNLNKRQTGNLNDIGDKVCFPNDVVWEQHG